MTDDALLGDTSIFKDSTKSILASLGLSSPEKLTEILDGLLKKNLQPARILIQKLRILVQLHMNLETHCNKLGIDLKADDPVANELRQAIQTAFIDVEDAVIALRYAIEHPSDTAVTIEEFDD